MKYTFIDGFQNHFEGGLHHSAEGVTGWLKAIYGNGSILKVDLKINLNYGLIDNNSRLFHQLTM
jgi:hypothetical protein